MSKQKCLALLITLIISLSLPLVSHSQESASVKQCFVWDQKLGDQYLGRCLNHNYSTLLHDGGPRPLRCTNMTFPSFWSCHHLYDEIGAHAQDLKLDVAAAKACACSAQESK